MTKRIRVMSTVGESCSKCIKGQWTAECSHRHIFYHRKKSKCPYPQTAEHYWAFTNLLEP